MARSFMPNDVSLDVSELLSQSLPTGRVPCVHFWRADESGDKKFSLDVQVLGISTHAFRDFVGSVGSISETHGMPSFFISTARWKR